jgi:hypothetical protein
MLKTASVLLAIALLASGSGVSARQAPTATAKALHCGYGGVGILPYPLGAPPPPDFDRYSAIAVVEINSARELRNVAVSAFAIIDQTGAITPARRIVEVEDFRRVPTPNLGSSALLRKSWRNAAMERNPAGGRDSLAGSGGDYK